MSFSQVKLLRQSGQLQEALDLAREDLEKNPGDLWNKRSMEWVLYELIKQGTTVDQFINFTENITKLLTLELPGEEKMIFDNVAWQIVKMGYNVLKDLPVDFSKLMALLEIVVRLPITKPSDPYSAIFKVFYKVHLEWAGFPEFVRWWNFDNFRSEDYLKEKMPDGKEVISLAERGYIAYAKCLLEGLRGTDPVIHSATIESLKAFLPQLDKLIEDHPEYVYPPYFKAKILLALGDKDNVLSAFLPFARSKATEFWVWDLLADIFQHDEENHLACLCKALTCRTPPDFLIKVRFKLAEVLVRKQMYMEAKTEIIEITKIRTANQWPIPAKIIKWTNEQWYSDVETKRGNSLLFNDYQSKAEDILFHDIPEEVGIVEFVNQEKKILRFVINTEKFGFFKYEKYLKRIEVGDSLLVRLEGAGKDAHFKILTVKPSLNKPSENLMKTFEGIIRIREGQSIGFVNSIFVEPGLIASCKLSDGQSISGMAILSYNKKRNELGWKAIKIFN